MSSKSCKIFAFVCGIIVIVTTAVLLSVPFIAKAISNNLISSSLNTTTTITFSLNITSLSSATTSPQPSVTTLSSSTAASQPVCIYDTSKQCVAPYEENSVCKSTDVNMEDCFINYQNNCSRLIYRGYTQCKLNCLDYNYFKI